MSAEFKMDYQLEVLRPVAPRHVAFNKPAFLGGEIEEIRKAIQEKASISGDGFYTHVCERYLSELYQSPTLITSSCTHALEMAAILLNIQPGDEVIVPSYTFVSTANAFALRGATIRFADCDAYGQLDLHCVQKLVSRQTKAVCVVHYAGNSANMETLSQFCKVQGLFLIEDAAQAIGARHQNQLLGTWGDLGCLSFHETKNITSGEGGALIINNPALLERAHFLREKGTNRKQFIDGLVDKYTWVDIGSSYVLSDMNAAHLSVQLQNMDKIHARRAAIWNRYVDELNGAIQAEFLEIPPDNTPNYHLVGLLFDSTSQRTAFIHFMKERSVVTPFHYVALHDSPMGKSLCAEKPTPPSDLKNTLRFSQCLARLPIFYNMTDSEQDWVIDCVKRFFKKNPA
jgi:dTDP-4-amino-4,6-dideoxygalactose transaminase